MRRLKSPVLNLSLTLLLAAQGAPAFAQSVDILGVKLGMTSAEALAALKAQDPKLTFTNIDSYFGYSDGVKNYETKPFLSEIQARRTGTHPSSPAEIRLYFTPPPNAQKLWVIERREKVTQNPPSFAQYTAALNEKYGKPVATDGSRFAWDFPAGKQGCLRKSQTAAQTDFRPDIGGNLDTVLQFNRARKMTPADFTQCASSLFVALSSMSGDVVNAYSFLMVDVAANEVARSAANKWVGELEAGVKKARESKGQTPAL